MAREVRRDLSVDKSDIQSLNAFPNNYRYTILTSEPIRNLHRHDLSVQIHFLGRSGNQSTWRFSTYPPELPIFGEEVKAAEQPRRPLSCGAQGQMRCRLWA